MVLENEEFNISITGPKEIPLTLILPNGSSVSYESAEKIEESCVLEALV